MGKKWDKVSAASSAVSKFGGDAGGAAVRRGAKKAKSEGGVESKVESSKTKGEAPAESPEPEVAETKDGAYDPDVPTEQELLPSGLITDFHVAADRFATLLPRGDLAKEFAAYRETQLAALEAARAHTGELVAKEQKLRKSKMEAAKFQMMMVRQSLQNSRTAASVEKEHMNVRLSEQMSKTEKLIEQRDALLNDRDGAEGVTREDPEAAANLLATEAGLAALQESLRDQKKTCQKLEDENERLRIQLERDSSKAAERERLLKLELQEVNDKNAELRKSLDQTDGEAARLRQEMQALKEKVAEDARVAAAAEEERRKREEEEKRRREAEDREREAAHAKAILDAEMRARKEVADMVRYEADQRAKQEEEERQRLAAEAAAAADAAAEAAAAKARAEAEEAARVAYAELEAVVAAARKQVGELLSIVQVQAIRRKQERAAWEEERRRLLDEAGASADDQAELHAQLSAWMARVTQLETELAAKAAHGASSAEARELRDEVERLRAAEARCAAELDEARKRESELTRKLEQAQAQLRKLSAKLAKASSGGGGGSGGGDEEARALRFKQLTFMLGERLMRARGMVLAATAPGVGPLLRAMEAASLAHAMPLLAINAAPKPSPNYAGDNAILDLRKSRKEPLPPQQQSPTRQRGGGGGGGGGGGERPPFAAQLDEAGLDGALKELRAKHPTDEEALAAAYKKVAGKDHSVDSGFVGDFEQGPSDDLLIECSQAVMRAFDQLAHLLSQQLQQGQRSRTGMLPAAYAHSKPQPALAPTMGSSATPPKKPSVRLVDVLNVPPSTRLYDADADDAEPPLPRVRQSLPPPPFVPAGGSKGSRTEPSTKYTGNRTLGVSRSVPTLPTVPPQMQTRALVAAGSPSERIINAYQARVHAP